MATADTRNTRVRDSQRTARTAAEESNAKRERPQRSREPKRPNAFSGNLTHDPELKFTPSGKAVTSFQLAYHPRTWDKNAGEWVTGETEFWNCVAWGTLAENFAETFYKGDRVMVSGYWKTREYEDKDGNERTVTELNAQDAGASVLFGWVQIPSDKGAEKDEAPF